MNRSTLSPPVPEPPESLRTLKSFLSEAGYVEPELRRRLGLESLFEFRSLRAGRAAAGEPDDALGALVHLFMDGERLPAGRVRDLLGDEPTEALLAVRLLVPISGDGAAKDAHETVHGAGALLYPVRSLWIASDVNGQAPGAADPDAPLPDDAVYPALAEANRGFLRDLPDEPVDGEVLDLCSGSGIAALLSAPLSTRAWALDITERATRFARFNAALNGLDNVEARTGDLWEPVRGRRFARVTAHPPYLPALDGDHVFRDGGTDGERLLLRIVEGLPDHLEPGGLFYGHGMGTDRTDAPLEERLARLLGDARDEFRVAVLWTGILTPAEFAWSRIRTARVAPEAGMRHLQALVDAGVERFVRGTVLIERRRSGTGASASSAGAVVRRPRGDGGGWGELSRFLTRWRWWEEEEGREGIDTLRPHWAPNLEIEMRYRKTDGWLTPSALRLHTTGALPVSAGVPPALAPVLELFDGTRTPRQVLAAGIEAGAVPSGVPPEEFEAMVGSLLEEGVLLAGPIEGGD